MKLLLYCTKAKPYLLNQNVYEFYDSKYITSNLKQHKDYDYTLNGKIVAECDFEVEEIELLGDEINLYYGIENKSCLTTEQIENYLGYDNDYKGYAIHIKNLNIFDEPRNLDFYSSNFDYFKKVEKAPQNMMRVWEDQESPRVLISIKPEWLCKILNGEKTIEVRKKVLKEMLE
jgi:predicted transcriptional regulator